MEHPFNLQLEDLETLDFDLMEESEVTGGVTFTTLALGEEGGHYSPVTKPPLAWGGTPTPRPPICPPTQPPIKSPIFTTLALGEEGGDLFL